MIYEAFSIYNIARIKPKMLEWKIAGIFSDYYNCKYLFHVFLGTPEQVALFSQ